MKDVLYTEEEKEKMLKNGFPICVDKRHCNVCIRRFRECIERGFIRLGEKIKN